MNSAYNLPSQVPYKLPFGIVICLVALLTAPLESAIGATTKNNDNRKPNVVIIFTDDQGALDAGCYGAKDLVTPAIDSLADDGVRFTQFYSGAPVCSPSRAALLTGCLPHCAGVPGNVSSRRGHGGMPNKKTTIAEIFEAAGYATAHIGKWHLGYSDDTMPNAQGFDYSFGHMGGCIDNYSHFFYWNGPNRHDLWRNGKEVYEYGRFFPDLMVDEARRFIENNRERPFLLYFAMNTPHYPYQGTEKWLEHYSSLPYPRNLYAAFVSTLDERIGELLEILENLNLRENTIIAFQSDSGYSTETRAHGGGGYAGKFRGAKFSLFEAGIRVPAIISWPGHLPSGATRAQPVHASDWLPTMAELCGVTLPKDSHIDGKSLVKVIESDSAESPHDTMFWGLGNQWAVRRGPWKLIGNPRDPTQDKPVQTVNNLFLSNLNADPSEKENLAGKHPDIVEELKSIREQWISHIKSYR
ncbi:MAG: sulfatase-like hydrolase/transferase [Verrucomicrobia bacterium]|nr:sulfatase-like hydrolase/transferase [Verrucomicrobiota bacterium]MCF7709392.1 sulfatase-like hydrolase/transferase [Verrucomicrobiota bacterium]